MLNLGSIGRDSRCVCDNILGILGDSSSIGCYSVGVLCIGLLQLVYIVAQSLYQDAVCRDFAIQL